MPKDVFSPADSTPLNRRIILLGFVAVIFVVTALAVNSSWQINRIIKGYNSLLHQSVVLSHAVKTINFHLITMAIRLEHLVLAADAEQSNLMRDEIRATEVLIDSEYKIIDDLTDVKWARIGDGKALFLHWQALGSEIDQLLKAGKHTEAQQFSGNQARAHLAILKESIGALELLAHRQVDQYQHDSQRSSENITLVTIILAVLAIISVALLILQVWRTINIADQQRSKRQALIDQHILIAILDKEGRTKDVSSALCKFFGQWREELIDSPATFFLRDNEKDKLLKKNIISQISQGKAWRGEVSYLNLSGEKIWAESSIIPNFDEQSQIVGFTHVLHDMTNKKLASIDKLTGLLNRRSYDEILINQISLAVRNKIPIALAILDIDFFKRFNDLYGHPEGDVVLRKLGDVLAKAMQRPSDFVFRIGGEEFAILISGLDTSKLETFLNSIREKVLGLEIANKNSSVSPHLTVSIGAAILIQGAITAQQLYKTADRALYQAKVERNVVFVEDFSGEDLIESK
ncbi:MAG: sensor domain-containing diguanylate cyclase [Oceanospirillaceae bacterium]|nr:sensor domain-containing diguanylate cyclase [Oceanospirillaceae bacterium]